MFYCDPCKDAARWPETFGKSYGRCEMCEQTAVCNDLSSGALPVAHPDLKIRIQNHVIQEEP